MRIAGVAALVAAVALAAPAGCRQGGGPAAATGSVHGTILRVGGPAGTPSRSGAGTVTAATEDGRQMGRQRLAAGQQFSFRLPADRYRLSVSGTDLQCPDVTVTVGAGTDQAVSLSCPIR